MRIGDRADHRGQRQSRADRQVDPAGEDHEQLADRQHGDRGGLGEHVAGVAGGEEHRRQQRHRDDEAEQHQHRTEADHSEGDAQQPEVAVLPILRRHRAASSANR